MKSQIFEDLICRAEAYFGDIMGEMAAANYEEEGGIIGMVEGRFELSDDDIRYCMGDAILQVVGFNTSIDVSEIADYWFKRDYRRY